MALKQTSLNFDFFDDDPKPERPKLPVKPEIIVNEDPIEVDVRPKQLSQSIDEKKKSKRGRMKISDMAAVADRIEIPDDEELFSKSYYSIGTVSVMFKVNHSLLRFWENEFDILKPKKNGKGDRFFRPEDVKNLKMIYHLLRERKYTIEGAKDFLKKSKHADKKFEMIESLKNLKTFLHELKTGL